MGNNIKKRFQLLHEELMKSLQTLHNSCKEGEHGEWEPTKEGFAAMAENVEEVATLLNIKIKDLSKGETND